MPVIATAAVVVGGSVVVVCSAPYLAAQFIVRTTNILLRNAAFRQQARQLVLDVNEDMADAIFSEAMRKGCRETVAGICNSKEFNQAFMDLVGNVVQSQRLKDTISTGVLEALMDEQFNAQIKQLIVANLLDEELQAGISKAVIATVKTGIREALKDDGLKEVLTVALRDALEDPRLKGVLYDVLKEALANKDLHRATLQGVVQGLNPFKGQASSGNVSREPTPPPRRMTDALKDCREPQIDRSLTDAGDNYYSPRQQQSEGRRLSRKEILPPFQSNLLENVMKTFSPDGSR